MKASIASKTFTLGQVAALSGITSRTLDHWAALGVLTPSIKKAGGTGTRRVYSFRDVIAASIAKDLRTAGISLQSLRRVVREVRKHGSAFDHACVVVSGKEVYMQSNEDLIAMLRSPGQTHLFPLTLLDLGSTVETLRTKAENLEAA